MTTNQDTKTFSNTPLGDGGKRIAIFGSTGSIGIQTLEVIEANPDKFFV
jgi:hypothetical protein